MTDARPHRPHDGPAWDPPDGYAVIRPLGAGGMGEVLLARDRGGRPVALKVMHAAFAREAGFRARFAREITAARRVHGPWTAQVLDADPDAPRPWLATEYVDGPSLAAAVGDHGPLPEPTVRALGARIAEALVGIHDAGLVHRDLTPGNVLLAPDGPRVVDFGITRVLDGTRLTLTGHAVGTPAYMAPEQLGDGETGPAADVFTLGSLLCFAATGRGPFDDVSAIATLRRVLAADADLSAVPQALRAVVAGCLQVRPPDRPTPRQLADALVPDTRTPGTDPTPDGPWGPLATVVAAHRGRTLVGTRTDDGSGPRPGRRSRRTRRALVAGALALTVLAAGGAVAVAVSVSGGSPTPTGNGPVIPAQWRLDDLPPTPVTTPTPAPRMVLAEPFEGAAPIVPGWNLVYSPRHGLAYDVPPTWQPRSPSEGLSYRNRRDEKSVLSGTARFRLGFCGLGNQRALAGVTRSDDARSDDAARGTARVWADFLSVDSARDARIRDTRSTPVTVAGVAGTHVAATVEVPADADPCAPPTAVLHTVALPAAGGGSVVWLLLAGTGVGEDVPAADIDRMISTIRPTGQGCDGVANRSPGRWC